MESAAPTKKSSPVTLQYVLVVPMPGRSISDDHWEEIDRSHIEAWQSAVSLLKSRSHSSSQGTVEIQADWRPLVNRLRQNYLALSTFHEAVQNGTAALEMLPSRRSVRVPINVAVAASNNDREPAHIATHYALSFAYDAFLIMNLASPGACNLYQADLRVYKPASRRRQYDRDFTLSEYHFDLANLDGRDGKWPPPRSLPLEQVVDWYAAVRVGASQVPRDGMEKVLFALMHLARSDVSLNTVIWLFYALETFFDTRPGENFRTLVSRIDVLLSPSDSEKKHLKKNLRTLYDLRSSFVHGGRDVIHPLHNEYADPRVEASYSELTTSVEFGFSVLLASVQEVIARGWTEITFTETVTGHQIVQINPSV
jgi:hypothetical protein